MLRPEVLTLLYTILTEKLPLSHTFYWNKAPLSHSYLRTLYPIVSFLNPWNGAEEQYYGRKSSMTRRYVN